MAIEIDLLGPGFDSAAWRCELTNLINDENEWPMTTLTHVLLAEGNEFELEIGEEDPGLAPDAQVWLIPEGGIRGVTIKSRPGGIVLSMPSFTGARDWELAAALTNAGVRHGAQVEIDGVPQSFTPEAPAEFSGLFQEWWQSGLAAMRAGFERSDGGSRGIPILWGALHLEVTAADVESPNLHESLVEKMGRYAGAFLASDMQIETDGGGLLTLNVAGALPTLINSEADLIAVKDSSQDEGADRDQSLCAPIPTATFLEIMGDQAESLGTLCYIPKLEEGADPELFAKFREAGNAPAEKPKAGPPPPTIAQKAADPDVFRLTPATSRALSRGPILVFLLVAAADGNVDEEETKTFLSLLANSEMVPGGLFQHMLTEARDNFPVLLQEMMSKQGATPLMMVEFLAALEDCPAAETKLVREGLYILGHMVANASGGFLGLGSKISKSEREALNSLKTMLQVNPDELDLPE